MDELTSENMRTLTHVITENKYYSLIEVTISSFISPYIKVTGSLCVCLYQRILLTTKPIGLASNWSLRKCVTFSERVPPPSQEKSQKKY